MSAHAAEIHYHRTGICVDLRGSVCKQRETDCQPPDKSAKYRLVNIYCMYGSLTTPPFGHNLLLEGEECAKKGFPRYVFIFKMIKNSSFRYTLFCQFLKPAF